MGPHQRRRRTSQVEASAVSPCAGACACRSHSLLRAGLDREGHCCPETKHKAEGSGWGTVS